MQSQQPPIQIRYLTQCVLVVLLIATLVYGEPSSSSGGRSRLAFQPLLQQKNNASSASSRLRVVESTTLDNSDNNNDKEEQDAARDPRREISVQKSLTVPFSAQIAFDNFANLPRQAEFSPWLRQVDYLTPPPPGVETAGLDWGETKWRMGFRGLSFSWNAVLTTLERPRVIEWKSTTGLVNFGKIVFLERTEEDVTDVTLTMTFVAPRVICSIFRRSNKLANFVQNRMLATTLINFRDIVKAEQEEGASIQQQ